MKTRKNDAEKRDKIERELKNIKQKFRELQRYKGTEGQGVYQSK